MLLSPQVSAGQQWSQLLDVGGDTNILEDVVALESGASIMVGEAPDASDEIHAWAVKLDASGDVVWERVFQAGTRSQFRSVVELQDGTSAGDFVAIGWATVSGSRDLYAVSFDASGNTIWQKTYAGEDTDEGRDLAETGGTVWLVGYTTSFDSDSQPDSDVWVILVDESDGTIQTLLGTELQARIGTSDPNVPGTADFERGNTVVVADDGSGEVVIGGCLDSNGAGKNDLLAIRIDNTLAVPAFTIAYGGTENECAHESLASGDDIIFVGEEASKAGGTDGTPSILILSIDENGAKNWDRSHRSNSGNIEEIGWDIVEYSTGRLIVGGWADADSSGTPSRDSTDFILINADATDGDLSGGGWVRYMDSFPNATDDHFDEGCGVAEASDGDIFFVGESIPLTASGDWDAWTLKLDSSGHVKTVMGGPDGVCELDSPDFSNSTADVDSDDTIAIGVSLTDGSVTNHTDDEATSFTDDDRCTNSP